MMPSTLKPRKLPETYQDYLALYPDSWMLEEDWQRTFAPPKPIALGKLDLTPIKDLATLVPVKEKGIKFDSDKPKWSLMPKGVLSQVVEVMTIGAKKYSPDNWMHVEPTRYYDAMHRHVDAWRNGEKLDTETGKHHLAHAICCLIFMLWHDQKDDKKA